MGRALSQPAPVLIDEWQHHPPVWDRVRRAVDDADPPGPFLLTGSVAPKGTGVHTGAGRIVAMRMRPLSLAERWPGVATVSLRELLDGGGRRSPASARSGSRTTRRSCSSRAFPACATFPVKLRRAQLDGYIQRIIDKDFPELGHQPRNPAALRRWMLAYAAATATTASWEKVRDAATGGESEKPARTTVMPYRDVLERLYVLDPLPGWKPTRNHIARLTEPPKHHLADPALATTLLGLDSRQLLAGDEPGIAVPRDGTFLGALFESLVTQSVRVYAQAAEATVGHLRTFAGEREIDLIVERGDGRVVGDGGQAPPRSQRQGRHPSQVAARADRRRPAGRGRGHDRIRGIPPSGWNRRRAGRATRPVEDTRMSPSAACSRVITSDGRGGANGGGGQLD